MDGIRKAKERKEDSNVLFFCLWFWLAEHDGYPVRVAWLNSLLFI